MLKLRSRLEACSDVVRISPGADVSVLEQSETPHTSVHTAGQTLHILGSLIGLRARSRPSSLTDNVYVVFDSVSECVHTGHTLQVAFSFDSVLDARSHWSNTPVERGVSVLLYLLHTAQTKNLAC